MTKQKDSPHVALPPLQGISVCAGIAGIDLGLRIALQERYRSVCYIEREGFSASVLVARMEEGSLDQAPVWSDLQTFKGKPWRGTVDLVFGGIPCQPFSLAGDRLGVVDSRWLWPQFWNLVRSARAPYIFIENVGGIVAEGLPIILSDLAKGGFDAEWDRFQAKQMGAPHLRERFFLFAYAHREGLERLRSKCQLRSDKETERISRTSWWTSEHGIHRVDDGSSYRVDRSRAIGNSVVPIVAAQAWSELTSRALSRIPEKS